MDKNILLMPFVDQSENFTNGFECGQIWEQMIEEKEISNRPVHSVNVKQIELMCEHFGYEFSVTDCEDGCWHFLTCKPIDISNL